MLGFGPSKQNRETRNHHGVNKACSVDSSERSVRDEDSHWTPTIPNFGQLGDLRETQRVSMQRFVLET